MLRTVIAIQGETAVSVLPQHVTTAAVQCYGCNKTVIILDPNPMRGLPRGWLGFDYREGRPYCPNCSTSFDEHWPRSEEEFVAVIEVQP